MTNIVDKITVSISNYQTLRAQLNMNLRVGNKSLSEWHAEFFSFRVPEDVDPIVCRQLSVKVLQLNQVASAFYTMASLRHNTIRESSEAIYREKYQEIVAPYKDSDQKLPAAAFIETMAKTMTDDVNSICMIAEVEKDFWKDVLNYLTRCRKQLENITMNNALMMKAEVSGGSPGGANTDEGEDE
jgi:DNA polymerase elongation subunit (family B)